MPNKIKLTKRSVDPVKPPLDENFILIWDKEIPGFALRVTRAGVKSYILQYRIHGRQRKYTIGRHGDITADKARAEALALRGKITDGIDPQADKKKERGIPTLAKFADEYLDYARGKKKTWAKDRTLLRLRILPRMGDYRLDTIEKRQIEKLHHDIRNELTPATANRHLSLIKRMFNLALDWGHIDANPARGVKGFKENNQRTAWLTAEEIGRMFVACAAYPDPYVGALFPFLLMTGARRSEALQARWQNIDRERAMWLIPDAKSGRGRYVPLSPQAVALLDNLPKQPDNPYVFCGHLRGQRLVNVAKPWVRIKKAAKLPHDFRPHDLRHTFASWGVSTGIDLYQIQTLLGHSTMQMTQRYAHLDEGGIKASINHISDRMGEALQATKHDTETVSGS
jgi:integrase